MNSIKAVVSEPIEGHEEYHIMVSLITAQILQHWEGGLGGLCAVWLST